MGFWKTKKRSDERIWQQIVVGANWAGISNLQGRCSGKVRPCYNRNTSITERNSMEQNTNTGVPMTPTVDNKQKSVNGLKIATAIACIVAVCGIGFGVYGMMQSSQKDSQISDLKVQIKEDDDTITTIETPEIETTTNNGTTITITDTAKVGGGPYIENGYFYVPKWGVKYKLSNDLTEYGFSVMEDSEDRTFGEYLIGMSAVRKSDKITNPQARYFDDILSCSMIIISKITREKWDSLQPYGGAAAVVEKDDGVYVLFDYGKSSCTESKESDYAIEGKTAKDRMNAASEIILTVLSNPEEI